MSEVETRRHFRKAIPEAHQSNLDTRIRWLWNQRYGTVQSVRINSKDVLDVVAATLFLQAVMGRGDLDSISQIFQQLEGGPLGDQELAERRSSIRV